MSPVLHGNVLSWASQLEPLALEQAQRTANLPFVSKPLALMPDAHFGKGSTIGSVIATSGAIIPSAVGVDIGCGMIAVRTSLSSHGLPDDLQPLHHMIATAVPSGVGTGHADANVDVFEFSPYTGSTEFTNSMVDTARRQYGTLGSGNHFVEVCLDQNDQVWVVLHSGSRGIGNTLAQKHIAAAKGKMKEWFVQLEDPDLAYLPEGTPEFTSYINDLLWSQHYAYLNRSRMMAQVIGAMERFLGASGIDDHAVQCHHNFTARENHHGKSMWVTRKGAVKADRGREVIIPGSMGTATYIGRGLGDPASYNSCSHGAGRAMSRAAARKMFTSENLAEAMGSKSWNAAQAAKLVDEHPLAYKNIDQVMADQRDLVEITHTLRQILNYKGA